MICTRAVFLQIHFEWVLLPPPTCVSNHMTFKPHSPVNRPEVNHTNARPAQCLHVYNSSVNITWFYFFEQARLHKAYWFPSVHQRFEGWTNVAGVCLFRSVSGTECLSCVVFWGVWRLWLSLFRGTGSTLSERWRRRDYTTVAVSHLFTDSLMLFTQSTTSVMRNGKIWDLLILKECCWFILPLQIFFFAYFYSFNC